MQTGSKLNSVDQNGNEIENQRSKHQGENDLNPKETKTSIASEVATATKKMPLWIKKGRIFKKVQAQVNESSEKVNISSNRHSVLDNQSDKVMDNMDDGKITSSSNIFVLKVENDILKEENKSMNEMMKKTIDSNKKLDEEYQVESMTVDNLQAILIQLEQDYDNMRKEGEKKLQQLKESRHQLVIQDNYHKEQWKVEQIMNEQVKKDFEEAQKGRKVSNKKVKELEVMVEVLKEKLKRSEAALQSKTKLLIATLKGNG